MRSHSLWPWSHGQDWALISLVFLLFIFLLTWPHIFVCERPGKEIKRRKEKRWPLDAHTHTIMCIQSATRRPSLLKELIHRCVPIEKWNVSTFPFLGPLSVAQRIIFFLIFYYSWPDCYFLINIYCQAMNVKDKRKLRRERNRDSAFTRLILWVHFPLRGTRLLACHSLTAPVLLYLRAVSEQANRKGKCISRRLLSLICVFLASGHP